jgi:hypothetical protein
MSRINHSEWVFILIAMTQIVLSFMIPSGTPPSMRPDPFPGVYVKSSSLEQAIDDSRKPQKITLPEPSFKDWVVGEVPVLEEPIPQPSPTSPPKPNRPIGDPVQAFLLEPRHQAILRREKSDQNTFRVLFRFEVYPKEKPGKLEILKEGKRIMEIPFDGSADGAHRTGAMLQKPGVYQWRIVTEDYRGDYRSFTLRP